MNKPQTGIRFRNEMLGCSHIQRLAEYVAAEHGLPRVDRTRLRRMYAQATPIPISLENETAICGWTSIIWPIVCWTASRTTSTCPGHIFGRNTAIIRRQLHPAISASPCRWNTSGYFTRLASPCSWPGIRFGSRKNFLRKFLKNRLRRQK